MIKTPIDLSNFTVALRKHVDSASPVPLRMMAAKGVVPMAPQEMALVLYQLSLDKVSQVVAAATETLLGTPLSILETAFSADLPAPVLDWAAEVLIRVPEALDILAQNPATTDETLEKIAKVAGTSTCDLVAENQVRLLAAPSIIEALYLNPKARMSTVDKLVDLARRNGIALSGIPAIRVLLESDEPIGKVAATAVGAPEVDLKGDQAFAQYLAESQQEEALQPEPSEEGAEEKESGNRAVYLSGLPVSQRIRVAILGSRQDRNILIRDSNRIVYMAVVQSPKVNEQDALIWSANRSMPEGVITTIANHREWMRLYQLKVNLVSNPKLPLQIALRLLLHLLPRDLKSLSVNRNVPNQLARQAKELVDKRMTRQSR